jgi:hypothetical protein
MNMNKKYLLLFFLGSCFLLISLINGCDKTLVDPPEPEKKSFTEEFDTVSNLYNKGWVFINNSKPQGAASWQQGIYENGKLGPDGFPAYSYKASGDEYIFAGYATGNDLATISSWMITPAIEMKNGDKFSFYTRTFAGSAYPDRMQVRLNLTDDSWDVGNTATSVGKFTTLLLDINPTYLTGASGYPQAWKKYEISISGLLAPLKRRIGFRYFVEGGGPAGGNSLAIGVDMFHFESLQ